MASGRTRGVWVAVTGLAVLGTVLATSGPRGGVPDAREFPRGHGRGARRSRVIFMIVTCLFYAGPLTFAYMGLYDRYILVWVPFALILIWEGLGRGVAPADTPSLSGCTRSGSPPPL